MKIAMASLSASPRMLLFSLFALRGTDVLASLECPNCRYELCAPNEHGESRHCLYGCKPGYYGRQCLNNCTKRECELNLDCNRHPLLVNEKDKYDCAVCPAGYYRGNTWETFNCTLKCPFNCKSCSAINDCHECKGSFYNEGIIRTCSIKCPRNCLTCLSPSLCKSCQSPYYNHGSVTNCSLSSCKHGLYGEHCTEACSSQCVNLVCDRLSGDCLFGKRKFVNSEKKFLSVLALKCSNCLHELRDSNEYCLYGCKTGYWSKRCLNNCTGKGCLPKEDCYRNPVLINGTGQYNCSICPDGYYRGRTLDTFNCLERCPVNCRLCWDSIRCNECKASFYSDEELTNCSKKCPENCAACLSPTICTKCKPPYSNDETVTNCTLCSCKPCQDAKCIELTTLTVGITFALTTLLNIVVCLLFHRGRSRSKSRCTEKSNITQKITKGTCETYETLHADRTRNDADYDTVGANQAKADENTAI